MKRSNKIFFSPKFDIGQKVFLIFEHKISKFKIIGRIFREEENTEVKEFPFDPDQPRTKIVIKYLLEVPPYKYGFKVKTQSSPILEDCLYKTRKGLLKSI